ncbi:MAG: NHL repeat-containing protein [Thermoanaerobaculia bacterium]
MNARFLSLLALFLSATIASAQSLDVDTYVGGTTGGGYVDATGTAARFVLPRAIASDPSGNLYVADTNNHVIRKISAGGEVTTLAGLAETQGFADGTGQAARFRYPRGIAFDPVTGDVIVGDTQNHVIRRVTQSGVVTTIAGLGGTFGTTNGIGSAARFTFPRGVVVDNGGVIYVADTSNHVIRRIAANGEVTTLAGIMRVEGNSDGFGGQATFSFPYDVAIDPASGNLYVSDAGNNSIRKVTPDGRVTTVAGSTFGSSGDEDGTGTDALFDTPFGIDVDAAGNVYVADSGNNKVRKITPAAVVTTFSGTGGTGTTNGAATSSRFNTPSGLTMAPGGVIYVADAFNFAVRRVTLAGETSTFAGSMPSNGASDGVGTAARLNFPPAIALDAAGNAYVTDSNCTIRKITPQRVVSTFAGSPGQCGWADGTGANARFRSPTGIGVAPDGTIYVADASNNAIRKITQQGVVTTLAGNPNDDDPLFQDGSGLQARFNFPYGLAVDNRGDIYVADGLNHRIRLVEPSGVVTTFAGDGLSVDDDGVGTNASFDTPLGIAVDAARNIYVTDWGANTIRRITQSGVVTTLAGSEDAAANWVDATGTAARFDSPRGIAADAQGNLFVADTDNHVIRHITPAGVVTTVAGKPFTPGNINGIGSMARFTLPEGLAVTASGQLLIADRFNHAIRIGTFAAPVIDTFVATPRSIKPGATSTLSWAVRDATTVTISGIGTVAATGTTIVSPQSTTTYTLTAVGPGGTTTQQVTVFLGGGKRRAARH